MTGSGLEYELPDIDSSEMPETAASPETPEAAAPQETPETEEAERGTETGENKGSGHFEFSDVERIDIELGACNLYLSVHEEDFISLDVLEDNSASRDINIDCGVGDDDLDFTE